MNRKTVYAVAFTVLITGAALGYVGAALLGPSSGGVRNSRLEVGDAAPHFRLPDHQGGYVRLSDFEGESTVVIAFYPLAWTPV